MEDPVKLQTHVDIKPTLPRVSIDLTAEQLRNEQRIPFPIFRPLSQRKENTWAISLFVILHLIAFAATMVVNDCWDNSHQMCALKPLGRFSFQPLSENPLLGPSASALEKMGALRQKYMDKDHQLWRIFTSPCLHAGAFHLIINLSFVIFIGIHLEQEFGSVRIGVIYILSAITGSIVASLFLPDRASVASSGALFGLLGAMLAGLIWNWKLYTKKLAAILFFLIILILNLILGMVPCINNYSNIGGLISGFLLGFMILFKPQTGKMAQTKGGLFEYEVKRSSIKLKQKFDRPYCRSISLVIFTLLLVGSTIAVTQGVNINKYCSWCRYLDCIPLKWWSCSDRTTHCKAMIGSERLTLTCSDNGKFAVFPFTNVSQARMDDLCNLICS